MRLSVQRLQRPEAWALALMFALGAFVAGRQTAPVRFTDIEAQAARLVDQNCQTCLESDVRDLTSLQVIEELDAAICPRAEEERDIWYSVRRGARVRVAGIAEPRRWKESPAIVLADGNRLTVLSHSADDEPFDWSNDVAGQWVTVEGCVRRIWYPTREQRAERHAKLSWHRQQTNNVMVAVPAGYAYAITVARYESGH